MLLPVADHAVQGYLLLTFSILFVRKRHARCLSVAMPFVNNAYVKRKQPDSFV